MLERETERRRRSRSARLARRATRRPLAARGDQRRVGQGADQHDLLALADVHPWHAPAQRGIGQQQRLAGPRGIGNKLLVAARLSNAAVRPMATISTDSSSGVQSGCSTVDRQRHPEPQGRIDLDDVAVEVRAGVDSAARSTIARRRRYRPGRTGGKAVISATSRQRRPFERASRNAADGRADPHADD